MEDQAVVVFGRRRGSHDQSEDPALHGESHARKDSFGPCGSFSDDLGPTGRHQRDPRGCTRNPLKITSIATNLNPDLSMRACSSDLGNAALDPIQLYNRVAVPRYRAAVTHGEF